MHRPLVLLLFCAVILSGQTPAPVFSLSIQGGGPGELVRGWPLLVQGAILHPQFGVARLDQPLLISTGTGSWTHALRLRVLNSSGAEQEWPLSAAGDSGGVDLLLDGERAGAVRWQVAAADTAAIAPGDYVLTGVLDTSSASGSATWKGVALAGPVAIQVMDEPAQLSEDQVALRYRLRAIAQLWSGDAARAIAEVRELRDKLPSSAAVYELLGDCLMAQGQFKNAFFAYGKAVQVYREKFPDGPGGAQALAAKQWNAYRALGLR